MKPLVFALPGNEAFAARLVATLGADDGRIALRRFPDQESYLRVETPVAGREAVIVCTLDRPDGKLLPLVFLADALHELGARRVLLAAPYLAYMRQDRRFQPGEAVTSASFARLLSNACDGLATVDPHLHRRSCLGEIYSVPTRVAHAASSVAGWIAAHVEAPLLVGPDEESAQWVSAVAEAAGAPYTVLEKVRRGDREVQVSVPQVESHRGRTPVLVDDIVSTGRTMIETARHLQRLGLRRPVCVGVHAVFAEGAWEALRDAAAAVATCNTVLHPTNAIDTSDLVAEALAELRALGIEEAAP